MLGHSVLGTWHHYQRILKDKSHCNVLNVLKVFQSAILLYWPCRVQTLNGLSNAHFKHPLPHD